MVFEFNLYTTLLIALISLIGIILNLKDKKLLWKDRKDKLDYINKKHENTALFIKYEVLDNLDIVEESLPGIDMDDNICIGKLPCKNHAWNTLYKELPGVFDKNELNILIKFYQEIDKLLDDRNWLKSVESKEIGAIESSLVQTNPLTGFDLEKIKNNKILISKILNNILELKCELNFIKKY